MGTQTHGQRPHHSVHHGSPVMAMTGLALHAVRSARLWSLCVGLANVNLRPRSRVPTLICHCEQRPPIRRSSRDVSISMRLNTRRRTAVATATRLPRYARNDKVGTHEAPMRATHQRPLLAQPPRRRLETATSLVDVLPHPVGANSDTNQMGGLLVVNLTRIAIGSARALHPLGQHVVASGIVQRSLNFRREFDVGHPAFGILHFSRIPSSAHLPWQKCGIPLSGLVCSA